MQNSKLQLKIQKYLIIVMLVFAAMPVFAVEVSFDKKTQEIKVNQLFDVGVFINTDEESINAIEGKITFPQDLLEVKKVNDGNSIINFWIEKPKSTSDGQIAFSGIIPGGYNDSRGLIFSITFLAKKEGSGLIEIQNAKTLLNDGKGTEAKLKIFNFKFSIFKESPIIQPLVSKIKDLKPPEDFKPEIVSDPTIFNGKWFLVFTTQDKDSGIDHYEVSESRNQKIENRNWRTVESPYLLKDQKLKSFIYVKAIDKAGNERIVTLAPRYPLKWYEKWENWITIIIVTFVLYLLLKAIKSKIKYQK
jgi:hypothetical protein